MGSGSEKYAGVNSGRKSGTSPAKKRGKSSGSGSKSSNSGRSRPSMTELF